MLEQDSSWQLNNDFYKARRNFQTYNDQNYFYFMDQSNLKKKPVKGLVQK